MILAEPRSDRIPAALALPVATTYLRGFVWQTMRSLCGPTSVFNALRSLGDRVDRKSLLDGIGVATVFGLRVGGTTLTELAEVVHKKSARRATVLRDLSLDELRAELRQTNDPGRRYVANFHRGPLFGRGGGHHSPLGGYLEADDLALVLDTNKRIGPWLVSPERLLAAVATTDPATGRARGLLRVE
jgi:hypothetical protein